MSKGAAIQIKQNTGIYKYLHLGRQLLPLNPKVGG
jgi:hypothetical protein